MMMVTVGKPHSGHAEGMKTLSFGIAALAAATFALTGCGNESASGTPTTKSQADMDRMQQFIQCMQQHGIDIPDNPVGEQIAPAPGSNAEFDAAQAACAKYAATDD